MTTEGTSMTDTTGDLAAEDFHPDIPFDVEIFPARVEPGSEVILTATLPAREDVPDGVFVAFLDAEGNELGRGALMDSFAGSRRSAPVELVAPERPGPHDWAAVLAIATEEGIDILGESRVSLVVAPHPIALTLWDVPPATSPETAFRIRLGIKCPCGCSSEGWGWRIADAAGREIAAGTVGDAIWPGTTGLRYAEPELTAPADLGPHDWTVTALAPEGEIAHADRTLRLRVEVRPPADITLAIDAIDAETGQPVEHAKITAHPYRAMTGADGRANLSLPRGFYTIFVSGKGYAPMKRTIDLTADLALRAELYLDREATHADNWA
jgi:hypothetical protein